MSWVEWLKEVAERLPGSTGRAGSKPEATQPVPRVRAPRKGGESYALEWVRVLEDAEPGQDPNSTYTWELHPEQSPGARASGAVRPAGSRVTRKAVGAPDPGADAFDTYSWELQEQEVPEDPWGLNETAPPTRAQGVNPYDTGVFDSSWRGRFDRR